MTRILPLAAAIAVVLLSAQTGNAQEVDRAREHRIGAADQMVERTTAKLGRLIKACDTTSVKVWMPKLSEECKASVLSAYPILGTLRMAAASDDTATWMALVDKVHAFEREIEGPLYTLER
jgi:hypothetical protein